MERSSAFGEENQTEHPVSESITESNEPRVALEHKIAHVYWIVHEGQRIGEVEIPTDLAGDSYAISDIHIDEPYRGKGFGTATYKALIAQLDKPIEAFGASPEAERVWESLVRQGLAQKTEQGYRSLSHDRSQ
jgi:GNAT superfamily N-acetyltransferase